MTLDIAPRRPPQPPAPVGRNDPCPCLSGLKFKKCCLDRKNRQLADAQREARELVAKMRRTP